MAPRSAQYHVALRGAIPVGPLSSNVRRQNTDRRDHHTLSQPELMTAVVVEISRFVDEHQPGFVECALVDASGTKHTFIEKVPVVSTANLLSSSQYPQLGFIACEVQDQWQSAEGASLVRICTERPWGVESKQGVTTFVVTTAQLVRNEIDA